MVVRVNKGNQNLGIPCSSRLEENPENYFTYFAIKNQLGTSLEVPH